MLALVKDIETALEAKAYLSALALALTIPDICGQIEYPQIEEVGKRYRRWFKKYVSQYYEPNRLLKTLGIREFDAHACYKLRCAVLHSGNTDIDVDYIDQLDLYVGSENGKISGDKGHAIVDMETSVVSDVKLHLDVEKLCQAMCAAEKQFENTVKDKSVFNRCNITIRSSEFTFDSEL